MIRGAEIGERFDGATFDNYEVGEGTIDALRASMQFAKGEIDGIVLIAPVGLGKTHLLVALAREYDRLNSYIPPAQGESVMREVPPIAELIEQAAAMTEGEMHDDAAPSLSPSEITKEVFIEFWPILDLAAELIRDVKEGGDLIDRVMNCSLLVLDDLGREKGSDFILQQLQRIIDHRYRKNLPMAVSTNSAKKEIIRKYGEHTISRWIESCEVITMTGKDYRMHGSA
jgi:DNA replication protein DnaC